jgi:hypothetical protein
VARTWWWDGQEVVELRFDDQVELRIRETTWPFALFSGRVSGQTLVGIDSRGLPLELADDGATLSGQGMLLTAAVSDSAHPGAPQP